MPGSRTRTPSTHTPPRAISHKASVASPSAAVSASHSNAPGEVVGIVNGMAQNRIQTNIFYCFPDLAVLTHVSYNDRVACTRSVCHDDCNRNAND